MNVNQQALEGHWTEVKGKLRERWGELSNDELESAHGNVEQLVGAIQRRTGETRESVEHYLERLTNQPDSKLSQAAGTVREYADAAQDSVQRAGRQAAEQVKAGYSMTARTVKNRPVESLAACFGAGLITGVVLGMLVRSR